MSLKRMQFNIAHFRENLMFLPCKDTSAQQSKKLIDATAIAVDAWDKANNVTALDEANKLYELAKRKELYSR